jgi:hypothetical protein
LQTKDLGFLDAKNELVFERKRTPNEPPKGAKTGCGKARSACHSEELPWACGPGKWMKIPAIVARAKAGAQDGGFPLARE